MLRNILILLVLLCPLTSRAQVLFSEIAWMGTDEADVGRYNEWIEIYNFSNSPTDLTGWTITSADGKISISLKCTLAPHGVAVLERTDETTLPDITELLTYTGELVNGGTTLTIKDPSGNISHEVVGGENWSNIGGTNITPKQTPQYTPSGWVPAPPTPMGQSAAGDAGTSNVTCPPPEEVNEDEEDDSETGTPTPKSSGGGGGSSGSARKAKETVAVVPGVLSMTVTAPKTAYVNQTIEFEAVPQGIGKTLMNSLIYSWNFGDTYVGNGKKISHVFSHPGEYIVVVEAVFAKQKALIRHDITVLPTSFELSRTDSNDILLHNNAKYEVDIGGYVLQGDSQFTFPKFTYVKANGMLIVPKNRIGQQTSVVSLLDTERTHVALLGIPANTQSLSLTQYGKSKPTMTVSGISTTQRTSAVKSIEPVSDATAVIETIEKPTDTIVRIGNTTNQIEKQGFFSSIFKKFAGIFN